MVVMVAAAVAAARAALTGTMLPDSCAIQSLVGATSDNAGGETGGTWMTQATVACQITTARGEGLAALEAIVANRQAEVADASILVPAGTAITATQRIVATAQETTTTYAVVSVSDPTDFELLRTVKVQRVTP